MSSYAVVYHYLCLLTLDIVDPWMAIRVAITIANVERLCIMYRVKTLAGLPPLFSFLS